MAKKRVFISFDYDHDEILKIFLVGQADLPDSPFEFTDASIKEPLTGDWIEKASARIKRVDLMAVICGQHTNTARGVSAEVVIAQTLNVPYFLLQGYKDKVCVKPTDAWPRDQMYEWTWPNLKILIGGGR